MPKAIVTGDEYTDQQAEAAWSLFNAAALPYEIGEKVIKDFGAVALELVAKVMCRGGKWHWACDTMELGGIELLGRCYEFLEAKANEALAVRHRAEAEAIRQRLRDLESENGPNP